MKVFKQIKYMYTFTYADTPLANSHELLPNNTQFYKNISLSIPNSLFLENVFSDNTI